MSDDITKGGAPSSSASADRPAVHNIEKPLHHLRDARQRQGLSVRCVAKRLQTTMGYVREQEQDDADLLLSELYAWQKALDVPIGELLLEPNESLAPGVLDRARMLRVMKTVQALRSHLRSPQQKNLADALVRLLVDLMPELETVSAWPTVGKRRTSEELGRIVENPISERWINEAG